jgi:Ca2+-binding EF-hand superfamily protein
MLNIFAADSSTIIPDIADGPENADSTNCSFLVGSPRDLLISSDIQSLSSSIREAKNSLLHYRLFSHRKLLKIQRLISENEIVGRYDVIPGLSPKSVIPPNDTKSRSISCIGDDQIADKKRGVISVPSKPVVAIPLKLKISYLQILVSKRLELEARMIDSIAKDPNDTEKIQAQVLSRTLKVAIHNGHTPLGGDWQPFNLDEDEQDKDLLFTSKQSMDINGYVAHENMALVFLIEYEIGVPQQHRAHYNPQALLNSTLRRGHAVTTLVLGAGIFIPSNGKVIFLRNRPVHDKDDIGCEVKLRYDDICSTLSFRPNYGAVDRVLSGSRNSDRKDDKGDSTDGDESSGITLAFDLKAFDSVKGALEHEDEVTTRTNDEANDDADSIKDKDSVQADDRSDDDVPRYRNKGVRESKESIRSTDRRELKKVESKRDRDLSGSPKRPVVSGALKKAERKKIIADDNESIADSLVGGDSDASSLRLDPRYYQTRTVVETDRMITGRRDNEVANYDGTIAVPKGKHSLLARSMQAKIGDNYSRRDGYDDEVDSDIRYAPPKVSKSLQISSVPVTQSHVRELSRGVKSRLSRHGFDGVIQEGPMHSNNQITSVASRNLGALIDINVEANDSLTVNDITIQFAGYRAGLYDESLQGAVSHPRSLYFSFQFFTCLPTRTEPMRLLPSERGQACVFARDEAHSRDETPLALRYIVDCSQSSPTEAHEFAEYLAHSTLFIDVWDTDSLLLVGTCGVPLRRIMRQGQSLMKSSIEVDVINSDVSIQSQGGIATSVIAAGGPVSGAIVGSVQLIISNHGQPGKADEKTSQARISNVINPTVDLNWRTSGIANPKSISKHRPSNSVRARPLSESAPELSDAIKNFRVSSSDNPSRPSYRSLSSIRGTEGAHTLTYDEIVVIFKRFQGAVKGTVQYNGALMNLLDVPSWNIAAKKLLKVYNLIGDDSVLSKEMLRYADSNECINLNNLQEFLRDLFDQYNVSYRAEDLAVIAFKVTKDSLSGNGLAKISSIIQFIHSESERQRWNTVSKRVRVAGQKAILVGTDLEQLVCEKDRKGSHYISVKDFKDFLRDLSKYSKLTPNDITTSASHFAKSTTDSENAVISLKEIMAFFGKEYVGNLNARLSQLMVYPSKEKDISRTPEQILQVLEQYASKVNSSAKGDLKGAIAYNDMEAALTPLGIYNELTHEQVRTVITKADPDKNGRLTPLQLLSYLGLTSSVKGNDMSVEYLLRLLLERVQRSGASIDETFRHFDADGNGQLTRKELEEGLLKLGVFEGIKDWKKQLPALVKKFDADGSGAVSIREFFLFLGITDYSPNIIQRMTKIFALAIDKGLTFKEIFTELDDDKDGQLNITDLLSGLKKLGTFGDITTDDAKAVVDQFDHDKNQKISMDEFIDYFQDRVSRVTADRKQKRAEKLASRFKDTMKTARGKGLTTEDLYQHFDKDSSGGIIVKEMESGLKKLPYFKNVSTEELQALIEILDADGSGTVSLQEFKDFLDESDAPVQLSPRITSGGAAAGPKHIPSPGLKKLQQLLVKVEEKGATIKQLFDNMDADKNGRVTHKELTAQLRKIPQFDSISGEEIREVLREVDTNGDDSITYKEFVSFIRDGQAPPSSNGAAAARTPKDIFIREVHRIAVHDGGVHGLLAALDNDEDGLISLAALMRLLRREKATDAITENDIDKLLDPICKKGMIEVQDFLNFVENKVIIAPATQDGSDDDFEGIPMVKYEFSNDPETRALEKKMRGIGRILAKQGLDVEGLFKGYDLRDTGFVRRSEFLEVVSKMGLYILEQGKVLEGGENESDIRKLQLSQVAKLRGGNNSPYMTNAARAARKFVMNGNDVNGDEFKEHLETMALINMYRQSQKKLLLQRVLSHSLATIIRIYPRFGKTLFFEQPITNPFNHEERFIIDTSNDPEIRLVTSMEEWLYLRQEVRTCLPDVGLGPDPVEAEMFDRDGSGNIQVVLLPHETLYLPFTYMTLIPYVSNSNDNLVKKKADNRKSIMDSKDAGYDSVQNTKHDDADEAEPKRCTEIRVISGSHGHIVAVVKVNIYPRPFVVNRTIRYFEPENTVMRRRIQLVHHLKNPTFPGEFSSASKYIHCVEGGDLGGHDSSSDGVINGNSQSRVVLEWGPSNSSVSGAIDILLRYKCGPFPHMGTFHLLLYDDPYQSKLSEIWHVIIQSRQRLDIHSNVGSPAAVDLVVRGDRYARRARAFTSPSPDTLSFDPHGVFQVVPGAYNRVALNCTPRSLGSKRVSINLVDVDSKELLNAWILTLTAGAPATMKTYDVDVVKGKATHKKIIFKNPWDVAKKFVLVSSDDSLMRPRTPTLDVAPHGNAYLRLLFTGVISAGTTEVYLFLNDEYGQNEESFLFRLRRVSEY